MSFNDWLDRRRLYTPDRIGVVDDTNGKRYSYAELDNRACRVARHLQRALNVRPGDRVACLSANRIEYVDLYFACGKIGAVLVPLNTRLPAALIDEMLQDCEASMLVHDAEFAEIAEFSLRTRTVPRLCPIDRSDQTAERPCLADILASNADRVPRLDVYQADELDTAMILYTSGTTGKSKGAMISYRQIHWNALNTILGLQLTEADAAFMNMPLYHTGGWHVLFTPLILVGGRLVLQPQFDAARCNELLGPEGITILFGVPTTLQMMWEAANFSTADFSAVRFAIFGGERCPLPVIEAFGARGVPMRQGYGLTEAGPNCFSLPTNDAVRKQGSIGFPNFHVSVFLKKEDGSQAGVGEVGELLMRGPHVFSGYWNNQSATERVLNQGWLATGDLMMRDEEGYYFVVGRKKDMFISGGENVYPAQIERVLQNHSGVAQAAVVGMPHPKWGEAGCAFIKLSESGLTSETELRAWCKQYLAGFQCPTKFVIMEEFPSGASGKIDKRKLASLAMEMAD